MRVVVVGASSGIGRSIGVGLAQRGDSVALLARRRDRLDLAAEEAGGGAVPVVCDVTEPESVRDAIAEAAAALGGIDGLVYAAAIAQIGPLERVGADEWAALFATNVIGAALVTAAALPHLAEAEGAAVYLSSISASLTPSWPMIGGYATTKAALDKLVEAWRVEHPEVGFTRLTMGDCIGGDGALDHRVPGRRRARADRGGVGRVDHPEVLHRELHRRRAPDRPGAQRHRLREEQRGAAPHDHRPRAGRLGCPRPRRPAPVPGYPGRHLTRRSGRVSGWGRRGGRGRCRA